MHLAHRLFATLAMLMLLLVPANAALGARDCGMDHSMSSMAGPAGDPGCGCSDACNLPCMQMCQTLPSMAPMVAPHPTVAPIVFAEASPFPLESHVGPEPPPPRAA